MNDTSIKCPYVYIHNTIHTLGYITPCCNASPQDDLNWMNTKLTEGGLHAPYYYKIREQMQAGEWPKICNVCKKQEEIGIKSPRLRALDKFNIDYNSISLKYIDVKFNSKCNLACRMCFPHSSSLVEEYYDNFEKPYFLRNEDFYNKDLNKEIDQKEKIEYIKSAIINGLEILKITGGEPFASKEFMHIIDWCLTNNYTKLELKITTNGTKLNTKIIEKLIKFKKVVLNISIDGTKETYSYIRYKANWLKLDSNIKKLLEYKKSHSNLNIFVSCLLMFYNLLDIKNLTNWCYNNNLLLFIDTYIKPWDSEIGVKFLPNSIIQDAIKDISSVENLNVITNYEDVLNFLHKEPLYNEFMCKKLKETTKMFDRDRSQSYQILNFKLVEFLDKIEL